MIRDRFAQDWKSWPLVISQSVFLFKNTTLDGMEVVSDDDLKAELNRMASAPPDAREVLLENNFRFVFSATFYHWCNLISQGLKSSIY